MHLPGYGVFPKLKMSHKTTPKLQTSIWVEKVKSLMDSIAIHLTGRGPFIQTINNLHTLRVLVMVILLPLLFSCSFRSGTFHGTNQNQQF